jgi:hypothetical protein
VPSLHRQQRPPLKERGLLQDRDRFLRIVNAWQFDDDLIAAPCLDKWLTDAKTVYPAFERLSSAFQRIAVERLARDRARLQDDLQPSL